MVGSGRSPEEPEKERESGCEGGEGGGKSNGLEIVPAAGTVIVPGDRFIEEGFSTVCTMRAHDCQRAKPCS